MRRTQSVHFFVHVGIVQAPQLLALLCGWHEVAQPSRRHQRLVEQRIPIDRLFEIERELFGELIYRGLKSLLQVLTIDVYVSLKKRGPPLPITTSR